MKPQDLRIGNWVQSDDGRTDELLIVDAIHTINSGHIQEHEGGLFGMDQIKPIPLTEEWLLKLGGKYGTGKREGYWFKAGEYEMCVTVNAFTPGKIDEEAKWFVSIQTGCGSQPVTVVKQFVHEFQNLFHALTGEDLKTNEQ